MSSRGLSARPIVNSAVYKSPLVPILYESRCPLRHPLLEKIRQCQVCSEHLPMGPRPIVQGHPGARLLIVGQAPGLKVHQTGVPWNDPSGDRLRQWLGLSRDVFYDPEQVALLPIGFCYPGRGRSGDLPPRKECFDLWHQPFVAQLANLRLTLLVGSYAQSRYLNMRGATSTTIIRNWSDALPDYTPLPHPSPRNNIWLRKNSWFEQDVLPHVRALVDGIFSDQ